MPTIFDPQDQRYTQYESDSTYDRDEGVIIIPLAKLPSDPPPHFRVVRIHAPIGTRKVRFRATKQGTPPLLPSVATTPSGDVPMMSNLTIASPDDAAQGMHRVFTAQGEYTYIQNGVNTLTGAANAVGTARRPGFDIMHTGRPPIIRMATDTLALAAGGLLGAINMLAPRLAQWLGYTAIVDANLKTLTGDGVNQGRVVKLDDPNFNEYGVDVRADYFTDGVIR